MSNRRGDIRETVREKQLPVLPDFEPVGGPQQLGNYSLLVFSVDMTGELLERCARGENVGQIGPMFLMVVHATSLNCNQLVNVADALKGISWHTPMPLDYDYPSFS